MRIFDYTKFVEPLPEEIREDTENMARDPGQEVEFIRRKDSAKKNGS
ncbi:MAG: hypothetical protein ACP5VS_13710 [Desulfomonilaceae bacterium]